MKFLKIAVRPIILLSLMVMGGCATSTISAFENISPSENNKVAILSFVVTEKNMETKKPLDVTEKEVADVFFTSLKDNLSKKGVLVADGGNASLYLDVRMYYRFHNFFEWLVAGEPANVLITRAILKGKNGSMVAKIDSKDGTG